MPPLYITRQGARLRILNNRIVAVIEESGEELVSIPLGQVSQLVLFGNIGLTTPAIGALLDAEIEVAFFTQSGRFRGHLTGGLTPHVPLRRMQYQRLGEADYVLEMAKGFVAAKLRHMSALLRRHNRERQDEEISAAADRIQDGLAQVAGRQKMNSLRGVEGAASAAYFSGFRRLFAEEWHFSTRQRRPPPDPVNAMLSFGYTLLSQVASGAAASVGLDPYAGFLHELVYNRPALGLDLVEEFRPVVDGIVLWCCNSGQVTPEDFSTNPETGQTPHPGGVILNDEGKRRFLQAYEQRLEQTFTHPERGQKLPLRQCILEQARQVRRRILDGPAGYQGMGFR